MTVWEKFMQGFMSNVSVYFVSKTLQMEMWPIGKSYADDIKLIHCNQSSSVIFPLSQS